MLSDFVILTARASGGGAWWWWWWCRIGVSRVVVGVFFLRVFVVLKNIGRAQSGESAVPV